MDSKVKIEDNFLPQKELVEIQEMMTEPASFPWFYNNLIDLEDDENKFQFLHVFYFDNKPQSPHLPSMTPILELLQPLLLYRIKANLLTRTPEIVQNRFHVDMEYLSEEKRKQFITSIFYVNTNNGYTKFENGTKIESVANRMISFPANMRHTGTSCTDERIRVVINFNYCGME
jgi:hypothetical protein